VFSVEHWVVLEQQHGTCRISFANQISEQGLEIVLLKPKGESPRNIRCPAESALKDCSNLSNNSKMLASLRHSRNVKPIVDWSLIINLKLTPLAADRPYQQLGDDPVVFLLLNLTQSLDKGF